MGAFLKHELGQALKPLLVLALALSLFAPVFAGALTQDVTTAKSNETSTGNILGGEPTRVTWEALVDSGEAISDVTVQLPEGSSFSEESTVRITILDGTTRLEVENTAVIDVDSACVNIEFAEPLTEGLRLRVEMYKTCLPNVDGEVFLSASYTLDNGRTVQLGDSPSIRVSHMSTAQKISNWLDEQPWVQAWNSVTILRLFFEPQLIVESIPTVFIGWLLSLMLVCVGFPLAIPIGLAFAFMKISNSRILKVIASIYTGVVRGTPLFLQIYIAFFGLPLLGLNINQYVLAIIVMSANSGAYLCEIFRAGIQSIPRGQFEASRSLGMTSVQTMFFVIIPQTVRRVIPTMTSEFILLYKDTSLLAAVGVMEMMLYARSVVSLTGNMTPYIVAAVFYLIVTLPLIRVVTHFENKLAASDAGAARTEPKEKKKRGNATIQQDAIEERENAREQARLDAEQRASFAAAVAIADDASFISSAAAQCEDSRKED